MSARFRDGRWERKYRRETEYRRMEVTGLRKRVRTETVWARDIDDAVSKLTDLNTVEMNILYGYKNKLTIVGSGELIEWKLDTVRGVPTWKVIRDTRKV